jgi:hypothetical protein
MMALVLMVLALAASPDSANRIWLRLELRPGGWPAAADSGHSVVWPAKAHALKAVLDSLGAHPVYVGCSGALLCEEFTPRVFGDERQRESLAARLRLLPFVDKAQVGKPGHDGLAWDGVCPGTDGPEYISTPPNLDSTRCTREIVVKLEIDTTGTVEAFEPIGELSPDCMSAVATWVRGLAFSPAHELYRPVHATTWITARHGRF